MRNKTSLRNICYVSKERGSCHFPQPRKKTPMGIGIVLSIVGIAIATSINSTTRENQRRENA